MQNLWLCPILSALVFLVRLAAWFATLSCDSCGSILHKGQLLGVEDYMRELD